MLKKKIEKSKNKMLYDFIDCVLRSSYNIHLILIFKKSGNKIEQAEFHAKHRRKIEDDSILV